MPNFVDDSNEMKLLIKNELDKLCAFTFESMYDSNRHYLTTIS